MALPTVKSGNPFFVAIQGYEELYWAVQDGNLSRLRMAYKIWKVMPEIWYEKVVVKIIEQNLKLS